MSAAHCPHGPEPTECECPLASRVAAYPQLYPQVLADPFSPWLESLDGKSTRHLIEKDTSGQQLVLRAARLAFFHGRMDGVAMAFGKGAASWASDDKVLP